MKSLLLIGIGLVACCIVACKPASKPRMDPKLIDSQIQAVANPSKIGEDVQAAIENLFAIARAGDCERMAPLLAFRSAGNAEAWQRGLHYEDPVENVEVNKTCAHLQVMLVDMESHTYKEFAKETESEGEWNIWTLELSYVDGTHDRQAFAFLNIDGVWLLGDID